MNIAVFETRSGIVGLRFCVPFSVCTTFTQINANEFGHHGALLVNVWLPWITRGIFLGQRRFLLSAQVCVHASSTVPSLLD